MWGETFLLRQVHKNLIYFYDLHLLKKLIKKWIYRRDFSAISLYHSPDGVTSIFNFSMDDFGGWICGCLWRIALADGFDGCWWICGWLWRMALTGADDLCGWIGWWLGWLLRMTLADGFGGWLWLILRQIKVKSYSQLYPNHHVHAFLLLLYQVPMVTKLLFLVQMIRLLYLVPVVTIPGPRIIARALPTRSLYERFYELNPLMTFMTLWEIMKLTPDDIYDIYERFYELRWHLLRFMKLTPDDIY